MNIFLLPLLLLLAMPAGPPLPTAQDSDADKEWLAIEHQVVPKIQKYRTATEEERKLITFHREIAEIGAFVRKFEKRDPDFSDAARVFLATELLDTTLGQTREAAQILRSVVQTATSSLIAGMAALHACDMYLRQGDEASIEEVIDQYSARKDHDAGFLEMMGDLRKRVSLSAGRPFPELPLVDREGRPQGPEAHRGKVLLLFLFDGADASAEAALALCARLDDEWREKGLDIVGISVDLQEEVLDAALKKAKATFPVIWDGKGWESPPAKKLGISTAPTYFILGRDGRIRFSWVRQVEVGESIRTALEISDDDQDDGDGPGPSGG